MQQIKKEELFIFSVFSWKQIVKSICPFTILSQCAVCTNQVWSCWQNASLLYSLVSIPRMEGVAALSADCVPDRWHKCCHFPFLPLTKPDVLSSAQVILILFEIKPLQIVVGCCRGMYTFLLSLQVGVNILWLHWLPVIVDWQTQFASPLHYPDEIWFCPWLVRS